MVLKDYDVNDVETGREYIEVYVSYFKFVEGEEEGHEVHVIITELPFSGLPEKGNFFLCNFSVKWLYVFYHKTKR